MTRPSSSALVLSLLGAVAASAGCSGGLDAGELVGVWRVRGFEPAQGTTVPTVGSDRVGGLLALTEGGELALARMQVQAGALVATGTDALVTTYDLANGELALAGRPAVPVEKDGEHLRLELDQPGDGTVFERTELTERAVLTVRGTVRHPAGVPPLTSPRAALVFFVRGGASTDARDDLALAAGTMDAPFDLSRSGGALGTQRVPYGASAGVAIGAVVVYDDRNGNAQLDAVQAACPEGADCVRGVSRILVGYRDGESPELAASSFAHLVPGWAPALAAPDHRGGTPRGGAASLDGEVETTYDVEVTAPGAAAVPTFAF